MKLLSLHFMLLMKNWKFGLLVFSGTSLFLLPAIFVSTHYDQNSWWFIISSVLIYGITLASFVGETQKELMSRRSGFLLPGLRNSVTHFQIFTLMAFALVAFLLFYFLPQLAPLTAGNFLNSLSVSLLVFASFTATLLVVFLYKYSSWLTSVVFFSFVLYIQVGKNADVQIYQNWLEHSAILITASILFTAAGIKLLAVLNLPRRLAEQPYLSTLEIYKRDKVQNFKNRHAAYAQPKTQGVRPLKSLMDRCLEKSSRARFAGSESWAIFWETLHLGLSNTTPRSFLGPWNYLFFIAPFVLFIGYADSMPRSESGMEGWYSSFPFIFTTFPLLALHFLRVSPLGLPRSRRATEKAGYLVMGWITATVVVLSLLVLALLNILGTVMPTIETTSRVWAYQPSSQLHTPFLPLLILPVCVLIYLLWARGSAQAVLGIVGMQVFLLYNFLLTNGGYGWALWTVLGISISAVVALPYVWRRRLWLET